MMIGSQKYLDPKNEIAFRKLFGSEAHKLVPIHFLNAILRLQGEEEIVALSFIDGYQLPEVRKESLIDLLVRNKKGAEYIVEMYLAKSKGFEKREQYATPKSGQAQLAERQKYRELGKIIFLIVSDYVVLPDKKEPISSHAIFDRKTLEQNLASCCFTYLELPKFNKQAAELQSSEEKWCYFLKQAGEENQRIQSLNSESAIKEAYELLDRSQWSENELHWYEKMSADSQMSTAPKK